MTAAAPAPATERGWSYAAMAVAVFFLLAADVLSLFLGKLVEGRPLSDPATFGRHWYATVGAFLCSAILWAVAALVIRSRLRRRGALRAEVCSMSPVVRSDRLLTFTALCVLGALLSIASQGCSGDVQPPDRPRAVAALAAPSWVVESNQALDALMFVNAISGDDLYAPYYPGLRAAWADRLGRAGVANADRLFRTVSMSGASRLLYRLRPRTLADLRSAFSAFEDTHARILAGLTESSGGTEYERQDLEALVRCREQMAGYLAALDRAGFARDWNEQRRPALQSRIAALRDELNRLPDADTAETLSRFLGRRTVPTRHVVLLAYASPIAFQLPAGVMASEARAPGRVSTLLSGIPWLGPARDRADAREQARRFANLALHESLHGFPGNAEAIAGQEALLARSPALVREYEGLRTRWHEGPEEYAVVAAEAYLSVALGLRDPREASEYIRRQNGGMTLSIVIYDVLRQSNPDRQRGWPGYSAWLVNAMRDGRIRER
jgi:hypothetical protein